MNNMQFMTKFYLLIFHNDSFDYTKKVQTKFIELS